MRFIFFGSVESKGSSFKRNQNVDTSKVESFQVVRFEDFEKANKVFMSQTMEKLNTRYQYLAALTGLFLVNSSNIFAIFNFI